MRGLSPKLPDVQKIAVLRAGGIGDLMFAIPALKSLRATYSDAELTLLAGDWQDDFLRGRAIVDRVVEVPLYAGVRGEEGDPSGCEGFFQRMRAERFDLAVQMHGGGRNSNPFTRRLGARTTAGLRTPEAAPLDIELPYVYLQSEVLRNLELVAALGCRPAEIEPSLPLTELDLRPPDPSLHEGRPLVVIGPGASDGRRRWPTAKFAAIARALIQAGNAVAVAGSDQDLLLALEIASLAPGSCCYAGRLSLNQFVGLVANAALFIGNDSGPLHVARAVGVPSVGIYWVGNLINAGGANRRHHRPVASWQLSCPVCGEDIVRSFCPHHESFVSEVGVEEVLFNAFDLLESAAR